MAIDQALLESVQNGGSPAVRFYRWDPPCLSLGRNQRLDASTAELQAGAVDVVRRPTGGLAVLHDRELTYSVVVPTGTIGSPRETYEAINRGLLRGLTCFGARLDASPAQPLQSDVSPAAFRKGGSCFAGTAPGEIVARGRKLIGSAQRCERRTILQHGSILLENDQAGAVRPPVPGERSGPGAITLRELLGRLPEWSDLVAAFASGLALDLGIALAPGALSPAERLRADALVPKYAEDGWTQRV